MSALIEQLAGSSALAWQARPGRGRLKFYSGDSNTLVTAISNYSKQGKKECTLAFSDEQYNWRVCRMPDEDEQAKLIKQRLKERLDPEQIMNPFVLL